jgi:hypothetical protein
VGSDVQVYVGGAFSTLNSTPASSLVALNFGGTNPTEGALSTWSPNPNGPIYALGVLGSSLLVGGSFQMMEAQYLPNFWLGTGPF